MVAPAGTMQSFMFFQSFPELILTAILQDRKWINIQAMTETKTSKEETGRKCSASEQGMKIVPSRH